MVVDLFVKLVPLAVHGAMSAYETRKGQLVGTEVGRSREATQTLNGYVRPVIAPLVQSSIV